MSEVVTQVRVSADDFDVGAVCAEMRQAHGAALGALVTFTGLVREHNPHAGDGSQVAALTLEHYPGMTEASIESIIARAAARWPLLEVRVVHRVGTMQPTEQIVLVAVASGHRDAAFAAAEFVMDYLKTDAVFWKKEQTQSGTHWVQSTAQDHQRAREWQAPGVNERWLVQSRSAAQCNCAAGGSKQIPSQMRSFPGSAGGRAQPEEGLTRKKGSPGRGVWRPGVLHGIPVVQVEFHRYPVY